MIDPAHSNLSYNHYQFNRKNDYAAKMMMMVK